MAVEFSVLELRDEFNHNLFGEKAEAEEIEDALYYLLKIEALKIEGGFLVIYNKIQIERLENDSGAQYKKEHYAQFDEYYQNKRQQIHIVGDYANRMINDYREGMKFVDDYFSIPYDAFLNKYFKGRKEEINCNITPGKFKQLFGELSPAQLNIINDRSSNCIVVAAGPGSGKTKLLVHKLASLCIMEDVKSEQMLMLTFSRAATTEFKKRLLKLTGNAANFIQITTFHSYCFDLLGRAGNIEKSDKIIEQAVNKITAGEVDLARITKTVLVIDEAQDMSIAEYSLVKKLMEKNDNLRIIAVGDDDQNIYEFRGSSSAHFISLLDEPDAKKYELIENYRSNANIVEFANQFIEKISSRRLKTLPINPVKKNSGEISICKLVSGNIVIPAVNAVLDEKLSGSSCVVARTNEEMFNAAGLLVNNGVNAKQIQADNNFSLYNLVELRDFINDVDAGDNSHAITDEIWQRAKINLKNKYDGSENLPGVLKLIGDFEETNNKTKYKSDLKQFICESKLEDFVSASENSVFVSTIHQTKGREFDNVFLALSSFPKFDDETKRAVYVALTRAKQNLHILYNGDYFDNIFAENIHKKIDDCNYPEPTQISFHLSHKSVALGYFAYCQNKINLLKSGQKLLVNSEGCFVDNKQVIKFSLKFRKRMEELETKKYYPSGARIKYIVFWQNEENKEIKIILPCIEFVKKQ